MAIDAALELCGSAVDARAHFVDQPPPVGCRGAGGVGGNIQLKYPRKAAQRSSIGDGRMLALSGSGAPPGSAPGAAGRSRRAASAQAGAARLHPVSYQVSWEATEGRWQPGRDCARQPAGTITCRRCHHPLPPPTAERRQLLLPCLPQGGGVSDGQGHCGGLPSHHAGERQQRRWRRRRAKAVVARLQKAAAAAVHTTVFLPRF